MNTICEECQGVALLDTVDADGVFIGGECECGYYITRYLPGMEPMDTLECGCDSAYVHRFTDHTI